LKPLLQAIDGITNIKDMQTVYAKTLGVDAPFFNLAVFPDLNDSKMNASYITQGGLGLPDRDYYVLKDDKSKERRQQ
jgi:putative endopeptidase